MEPLNWSGSPTNKLMALPVDEESDHYRLLAYLQRIETRYRERKLYPHLDELRFRLGQLMELRRRRDDLALSMPRDVTGMDLSKGELVRAALREGELLRVIDAMIANTVPELNSAFERGSDLRSELAAHIRFEPVGLLPLHTREGYLLIHQGRQARVYGYSLTLPAHLPERGAHHSLRTWFIADHAIGIGRTYNHIKADLVRTHTHLPNPAVFAFVSDVALPAIETFVPLAKQLVYEVVASRAA